MVWPVASIVSFTCLQENETPSFSSQKNLNNFNFNILCQLEIIRIVPDENEISFSLGGSVDLSPLSSTRTYLGFAVLADCGECPRAKLASSSCLRSSCRTISNWIILKISGLVISKSPYHYCVLKDGLNYIIFGAAFFSAMQMLKWGECCDSEIQLLYSTWCRTDSIVDCR